MSKFNTIQSTIKIDLARNGVFQIVRTRERKVERKRIARSIRVRAIGKTEDGVTVAQIRFRTRHGNSVRECFPCSNLLPENRSTIKNRLADLGYEWPDDVALTKAMFEALAKSQPKRRFRFSSRTGLVWFRLCDPGAGL